MQIAFRYLAAFLLVSAGALAQTPATAPPGGRTELSATPAWTPSTTSAQIRRQPGVPKGRIAGPFTLPSQVFPGTQHTYFVYVPAQYDPSQPTP